MPPYKSDAQRRWAHTEAGKEALGGSAAVHEWDEATKGKKLPEKVAKAEMPKVPSLGSTLGKQNTSAKTPKIKSPKDAFAPPSVFFGKSEDFEGPKHPSTRKLWNFLNKKHKHKG